MLRRPPCARARFSPRLRRVRPRVLPRGRSRWRRFGSRRRRGSTGSSWRRARRSRGSRRRRCTSASATLTSRWSGGRRCSRRRGGRSRRKGEKETPAPREGSAVVRSASRAGSDERKEDERRGRAGADSRVDGPRDARATTTTRRRDRLSLRRTVRKKRRLRLCQVAFAKMPFPFHSRGGALASVSSAPPLPHGPTLTAVFPRTYSLGRYPHTCPSLLAPRLSPRTRTTPRGTVVGARSYRPGLHVEPHTAVSASLGSVRFRSRASSSSLVTTPTGVPVGYGRSRRPFRISAPSTIPIRSPSTATIL